MKIVVHTIFLAVFIFSQAVAEVDNSATASIASAAKELAQSENQSNTIRSYLSRYSFGLINSKIDKTERKIESSTNFTHLNLNIGSDSLGLRNGSSALTELMAEEVSSVEIHK